MIEELEEVALRMLNEAPKIMPVVFAVLAIITAGHVGPNGCRLTCGTIPPSS